MKFQLKTPYKSIKSVPDIELPEFLILTGVNGAGKSQLLQALNLNHVLIERNGKSAMTKRALTRGLAPVDSKPFYGDMVERFGAMLENKFSNWKHDTYVPKQPYEQVFSAKERQILEAIKKKRGSDKDLTYISRLDVLLNVPPGIVINEDDLPKYGPPQDVFYQNLSQIFKVYQLQRAKNDFNSYLRDVKRRSDVHAFSDEEFLNEYGSPPWETVNDILRVAGIAYRVTDPGNQQGPEAFKVRLYEREGDVEIDFAELSTGEQVLMSLALALYNSTYDSKYPDILLMDEPDCSLHPSMANQFLRVIEEVFVKKNGVAVVMTTHSPSTVALAPESSLYVMSRWEPRIRKETKDRCLRVLTAGIPALSVTYDSRIQVFVESKYDAANLSVIYESIRDRSTDSISLTFISSGAGGAGCSSQVREVVELLRRNGNNRVFGLIDWDSSNTSGPFVKVLAEGRRYSSENLILDPLILGIYLIREGFEDFSDIHELDQIGYPQLGSVTHATLQRIVDHVVTAVRGAAGGVTAIESEPVAYIGGFTVLLPIWIRHLNGHELERAAKQAFPPLQRFRRENDLKADVLEKICRDYPAFLPVEFGETFEAIERQHLN